MNREEQIEMIKRYGNKNSCYVPFEGGGVISLAHIGLRKNRIHEDSTHFISERLERPKMRDSEKQIINYGYIGVGGQKGYVYGIDGIIPCLPATQYKDPYKIILSVSETSTKAVSVNLEMFMPKPE